MRIQCPPCGARYSIANKRIGADGRALSKCGSCQAWLVVKRQPDGSVQIKTADDVGDRRSSLFLSAKECEEPFEARPTLPIALPLEEADSDRPTERVGGGVVGVELDFDPSQAREETDPELEIRPLLGAGEVGFDEDGAKESTDPDVQSSLDLFMAESTAASPTAVPLTAVTPTAVTPTAATPNPGISTPAASALMPSTAATSTAATPTAATPNLGISTPAASALMPSSLASEEELPAEAFFPSNVAEESSADLGEMPPIPDLGDLNLRLPDPKDRLRRRSEVQEMLSEFSVMFRLDTRSRRRHTFWTALALVVVGALIVVAGVFYGGHNMPDLVGETRELLIELSPPHALSVSWRQAAPKTGSPEKKQVVQNISILSQQLIQLQRTAHPSPSPSPLSPAAAKEKPAAR